MLWHNGEACVALAAFLFSVSSLFVKLTSYELSVFEICTLSSAGCALILLLHARLPRGKAPPSRIPSLDAIYEPNSKPSSSGININLLVALRAVLGATTILCYYAAVEIGDIRDATALFFTSPLFTLLFDCLLHRRLPSKHHTVSAVFTAAGALMISQACLCMVLSGGGGSSLCPGASDSSSEASSPAYIHANMTASAIDYHASSTHLLQAARSDSAGLAVGRTLLQQFMLTPSLRTSSHAHNQSASASLMPASGSSAATTAPLAPVATLLAGAMPLGPELSNLPAVVLALTAAATNSAAFLTIQAIGQRVPALTLTFWHHTATATAAATSQLCLFVWLWLHSSSAAGDNTLASNSGPSALDSDPSSVFFMLGWKDGALVAGVMVTQLLAQVLLNRGFSLTSPTRGAAINVLQVVFSFVWDSAVLGNQQQASTLAGGLLIMGGVLVQAMAAKRKHDRLLHEPLRLWDVEAEAEGDEKLGGGVVYTPNGAPVLVLVDDGLIEPLLKKKNAG